ncbi:RNA-directed DNA polymerase from mobile element jockey [Trichonephila clavipes]|nr:RNA-directed DNA polymerase from mobile element jockey [Trichonephila clavipes]
MERIVQKNLDSRTTNSKLWRIVKKINKEQEQCEVSNSVIDTIMDRFSLTTKQQQWSSCLLSGNQQGLLTARTSASNGLLDMTKSPGPDGVFGRMLENLGHRGKLRLLDIINLSWKIGRLPAEWKRATIIPIKKAGKNNWALRTLDPLL